MGDSHATSNARVDIDSRPGALTNVEVADRLANLAQLLSARKENPYKIRAYRRAAAHIRTLSESVDELVRSNADLTRYAGIGDAIASAICEIVETGSLRKLDELRAEVSPDVAGLSAYPRLDPERVLRIYKKLKVSTPAELRERLESGELERTFGGRMAQHVREGLTEIDAMLLYKADDLRVEVEQHLLRRCGVARAQVVGDYRRRVEVVLELPFVIETEDFPSAVAAIQRYGGRTPLIRSDEKSAVFGLPIGIDLRVRAASADDWGSTVIACTGSREHLRKLAAVTGSRKLHDARSELAFYRRSGLSFIPPELREGHDELERAAAHDLPTLVTLGDIRGELHAHSRSSDGANSIEQMAAAARERGYEYMGITDHSQSLKIARGVPAADLWIQIRFIDELNERLDGIRILKSAEVDILADGSLDYPDELLQELDYTVCSIHSRFRLDKAAQTERILRAMDNRRFTILGHATGRLLLKRPGYEIDIDRVVRHAKENGCFFEINSSPDRLDLSAEHARLAAAAGVKIAVSTDAHSTREFDLIRCGLDQARRAGLEKQSVLNCLPWTRLRRLFRR